MSKKIKTICSEKSFSVIIRDDKKKLPRETFCYMFINFLRKCKVYDDKIYIQKIKEEYEKCSIFYDLDRKLCDLQPLNDEETHIFSQLIPIYDTYGYTNNFIPLQYRPFLKVNGIGIFPNLPIPKSMFFEVLKYIRKLYKERYYDKEKNKDFFIWTFEHELVDFHGDDIITAYEYLLEKYK